MSNTDEEDYGDYDEYDDNEEYYEDDDSDLDNESYDDEYPQYPDGGNDDVYVDPCDESNGAIISGCSRDNFFDSKTPRLQDIGFKESRLCCSHHHGYIYQNQCEVGDL